jgi:2-hydroxycyclohexanecarboxyl-CoA dehydrogenase
VDEPQRTAGAGRLAGRLAGRVAVVTGAGQGIGQAIAEVLAAEGAAVALFGRTLSKVVDVATGIEAAGGRALAVRCDVAERGDVEAAVAATVEAFGGVDIVVNNAQGGPLSISTPTQDLDEATALEFLRTGPLGSLFVMQACFAELCRSKGTVVNFGSGVAVRGAPRQAGYAMAKEAIAGLSKVTANEWGRYGIRVNVVCPVAVTPAAEAYRDASPARWDKLMRQTPLGRMGDPHDDVARAVLGLVSDDFRYLTGATLMLDGGQVIMR